MIFIVAFIFKMIEFSKMRSIAQTDIETGTGLLQNPLAIHGIPLFICITGLRGPAHHPFVSVQKSPTLRVVCNCSNLLLWNKKTPTRAVLKKKVHNHENCFEKKNLKQWIFYPFFIFYPYMEGKKQILSPNVQVSVFFL